MPRRNPSLIAQQRPHALRHGVAYESVASRDPLNVQAA